VADPRDEGIEERATSGSPRSDRALEAERRWTPLSALAGVWLAVAAALLIVLLLVVLTIYFV